MKASIRSKLETISERHTEIAALLSDPDTISDQNRFRGLSQEYAKLQPIVDCFASYEQHIADIAEAEEMLNEGDAEMKEMAREELNDARAKLETAEVELQTLLLPEDPYDGANVFLEVRAGTGGDEAAIFSGDLFRMYSRYAEQRGWKTEVVNQNEGEHGGYREVIARVTGKDVYARLKFESGAHRVQRVPETESQGRIHTSACTVAILPEVEDVDEDIDINPADLRVDTFRASGAGGQHVNKTDSAIRLTHLPSGLVVECQDERSQHKNRARAMSLLKSKLISIEREKQDAEQSESRKLQVGSGDRSERIRTYNYPQGRVTDHRINLTLYKLAEVMEGDLDPVLQPLINEHHADLLAQMERE